MPETARAATATAAATAAEAAAATQAHVAEHERQLERVFIHNTAACSNVLWKQ